MIFYTKICARPWKWYSCWKKDENAEWKLMDMISSNHHVVELAFSTTSPLSSGISLVVSLMKADIMQPIKKILKLVDLE